jgi:hypothetical protein
MNYVNLAVATTSAISNLSLEISFPCHLFPLIHFLGMLKIRVSEITLHDRDMPHKQIVGILALLDTQIKFMAMRFAG